MKHRIDALTRTRRRWWPFLDRLLHHVGGFAVYTIYKRERVGFMNEPVQDVEKRLRSLGFSREPVAALKLRAAKPHVKSAGSWVLKGGDIPYSDPDHDIAEMQLHVTLFALEDGTEINAHYEYRWEPHKPHWDSMRPLKHKKYDQYGGHYSPKEGVEIVTNLFDTEEIPYIKQRQT